MGKHAGWKWAVLVGLTMWTLGCGGAAPTPEQPGEGGPTLVGTVPVAGATEVGTSLSLVALFSVPVTESSLSLHLTPEVAVHAPALSADGLQVTWPGLELAAATSYSVAVSARDAQGHELTGQTTFTFSTAKEQDTLAPVLEGSLPETGAENVAVTTGLVLTFSEPMNDGSVLVTIEPPVELGEPSWSANKTSVSFPSMASFATRSAYAVTVTGADLAGNALGFTQVVFSTALPPDVTAPTVDTTAPSASAMNVPANAAISLSFSEPMDTASVDAAVSVTPAVMGTVLWDAEGRLRSFQPAAPLMPSTQYTVTVTTQAKDLAANGLAMPYSFSFTTAAAPDTTAPRLEVSTPAAGDKGVARNAKIVLTFSEPMDKAATQAAFDVTSPASANVGTFSWSADGKVMTFTPSVVFDYGIPVAWRLTTAARDLAANPIGLQVSRGFIVVRQGIKVLESTPALDGTVNAAGQVSTVGPFFSLGDSAMNVGYRGFLSFDLSELPADAVNITGASIYLYLVGPLGSPASLGGQARIEHIPYGDPLTAGAYGMTVEARAGFYSQLSSSTTEGWKSNNALLPSVQADWRDRATNGAHTQFRLRFPTETSTNGTADGYLFFAGDNTGTSCPRISVNAPGSRCSPHLIVTYEYP